MSKPAPAPGKSRAPAGRVSVLSSAPRLVSSLAKVASPDGFVDTEGDQYERGRKEHPAGMTTARPQKVSERAQQIEAAHAQANCKPGILLGQACSDDQGQSAEEPADRTEMQERRHEPLDRTCHPLVREKLH